MSPQLIEAMRKESFMQGWLRSKAATLGRTLAQVDDETILAWMQPGLDAYEALRVERGR